MRHNKAFQFCVGAFVLFLLFRLYQTGWFDQFLNRNSESEGVESVDLVAMFITAAVSAVQMVGLIAIGIVAGLQPLVTGFIDGITNLLSPKPKQPTIDDDFLHAIMLRLDSIEKDDTKTDE
jgi:hypothetical protein